MNVRTKDDGLVHEAEWSPTWSGLTACRISFTQFAFHVVHHPGQYYTITDGDQVQWLFETIGAVSCLLCLTETTR